MSSSVTDEQTIDDSISTGNESVHYDNVRHEDFGSDNASLAGSRDVSRVNRSFVVRYNPDKARNEKVIVYETPNMPGKLVRNAETGSYYNCHVGSNKTRVFYSVILATGELPHDVCLFYDSPEQCEHHLRMTVSEELKTKWREQYFYYMKYYTEQSNATRRSTTITVK